MKGCQIRREDQDNFHILHLEGSLDAYSFPQLETALNELRDLEHSRVILDCERLEYISSAGLGALIGFARRARERHGDLKLSGVSPKIQSIVELLGFHKILEILPDVKTAANRFES